MDDTAHNFANDLAEATTAYEVRRACMRAYRADPAHVSLKSVNDWESVPTWTGGPVAVLSRDMYDRLGGDEHYIQVSEYAGGWFVMQR